MNSKYFMNVKGSKKIFMARRMLEKSKTRFYNLWRILRLIFIVAACNVAAINTGAVTELHELCTLDALGTIIIKKKKKTIN